MSYYDVVKVVQKSSESSVRYDVIRTSYTANDVWFTVAKFVSEDDLVGEFLPEHFRKESEAIYFAHQRVLQDICGETNE